MEIWLDTSNIHKIQKALHLGLLSGVTTNPTIIGQSKKSLELVLADLLHYQEGPIAVQVVADKADDMVQQGQNLFSYSSRIIVKVPATQEGLEAIHLLSRQGIPTMATVIFNSRQALMAALVGADYVAPYLSHVEEAGEDPWTLLASMQRIFYNYRLKTKVLGASLKSIEQVIKCAEIGIYGVTVKDELFEELTQDHPMTLKRMQIFNTEWKLVETSLFD